MIQQLMEMKHKPELFEKGTASLWDDAYISTHMLAAHLNPDLDAASRKLEIIEKSVQWIHTLCETNHVHTILDLGCGPGLYTSRLARLGYKVTGLDFSHRSIQYAKNQAEQENNPVDYHYQDYLTMEYEDTYDLITFIYCDFGVLSDSDRDILLQKSFKALKKGGLFLFDVFTPKKNENDECNQSWSIEESGFWRPGPHMCLNRHITYPEHSVTLDQTIVIDNDQAIAVYNIWDHAYTVESITKLLISFGFEQIEVYADVLGNTYDPGTKTLCIVARKG